MAVTIPVSVGELVDKITILEIKSKNIEDPGKLVNIRKELALLERKANGLLDSNPGLQNLKTRLRAINEKLWSVEDALREMEKEKHFDADFIKLARSVYYTNDERSRLKSEINRMTNSDLSEEKSYSGY
ncbi:MAG: hypothetical protein GXO91_06945 [FCB group bacterium]|nr:hypothetical protein [FCB group bacterium]